MFNLTAKSTDQLRIHINNAYKMDEMQCVANLLELVATNQPNEEEVKGLATQLVTKVRTKRSKGSGIDALMQEFKLSSAEGVVLMCLAESLLRIPDKKTQDELIADRVTKGKWSNYTQNDNLFVNATSWGLLVTGKLVKYNTEKKLSSILMRAIAKGGEPVIRTAMKVAVKFMGNQFVMGETIDGALKLAKDKQWKEYKFSYDMLGEAAVNDADAMRYMQSYENALNKVGKQSQGQGVHKADGISVKLSAIHSKYKRAQYNLVMDELYARLKKLYLIAKQYQIGLFIDAEETERLELSLDLLEKLIKDPDLDGFAGIGFVVQAYQRRASYAIDYIANIARTSNRKIMVRLVKGAYWDSEIKKAQIEGFNDYPVFTRKFYTDLSYFACAHKLRDLDDCIYPLFATHNAYSVAYIYKLFAGKKYEFQCLFGMGESLYENIVGRDNLDVECRVYAPVGTHETLLAYLVRRLLENGANTSFVYQILDKQIPIDSLLANPITLAEKTQGVSNPFFKRPPFIYPLDRINSKSIDLNDELSLNELQAKFNNLQNTKYDVTPMIANLTEFKSAPNTVISPIDLNLHLGTVIKADPVEVDIAVNNAVSGFKSWSQQQPKDRSTIILKMADLLEEHYPQLLRLLVLEAGKSLANSINEVREAIDFCRYYAIQVIDEFNNQTHIPTGVYVCISPWNFPLAIFLGEVVSALVSGNCVIAKPSDQTNLIAAFSVNLLYLAGIPQDVVQLMPGSGSIIGDALTKHPQISGVIFTGSTEVAQMINQNLAKKTKSSILIAETGGQNAMIVDSTALPEQVVIDVVTSSFDSAGQRCSALRVLYLQEDIANQVIEMLKGTMDQLYVGNTCNLNADVGPVIDKKAQKILLDHIEKMKPVAKTFYQAQLQPECQNGIYVAPTLIEIDSIKRLEREVFGPILHIIRFKNTQLDQIIDEINSSGYGLTQGLHSRIEGVATKVISKIKAGNIYVNRNMIGAVVGVQPFGGEGLSGTGPKAGGAFYLYRLVNTNLSPKLSYKELEHADFAMLNQFVEGLDICGFSLEQRSQLEAYATWCKSHSPLGKKVDLVGPTGEYNYMFFAPRGVIGCIANDIFGFAKQIITALATNNQVVLVNSPDTIIFESLLPQGSYYYDDIQDVDHLNAVLLAKDLIDTQEFRQALTNRKGNLVIEVLQKSDDSYDLHLLLNERTASINTTATGGNVELMSINDIV